MGRSKDVWLGHTFFETNNRIHKTMGGRPFEMFGYSQTQTKHHCFGGISCDCRCAASKDGSREPASIRGSSLEPFKKLCLTGQGRRKI